MFDRREERNIELRNEEDTGGYDGRHWFRARIYSRINWVGRVAPFKDQRLFAERIKYYTHVKVHMPQFGDAAMLNFYGTPAWMWGVQNDSFSGTIPVSPDDIRRKLLEVNQKYLDTVGVAAFTQEAAAQSKQSIQVPLRNASLASSFAKLTLAKAIAKKAVTVMWRPDDQELVNLYVAVDSLPDTPDALFQALEKELTKPVRVECRTIECAFRDLGPLVDGPISDKPKDTPTPASYLASMLHAALTNRQEFVTAKSFIFGGSPTWILPVNEQINALKKACGPGCDPR